MNFGEKALHIVELIKSSTLVILPHAILRKTQIQTAEAHGQIWCILSACSTLSERGGERSKRPVCTKSGTGGEVKNDAHSELEFVQWQA